MEVCKYLSHKLNGFGSTKPAICGKVDHLDTVVGGILCNSFNDVHFVNTNSSEMAVSVTLNLRGLEPLLGHRVQARVNNCTICTAHEAKANLVRPAFGFLESPVNCHHQHSHQLNKYRKNDDRVTQHFRPLPEPFHTRMYKKFDHSRYLGLWVHNLVCKEYHTSTTLTNSTKTKRMKERCSTFPANL